MLKDFWKILRYKTGWLFIVILTIIPSLRVVQIISQQNSSLTYSLLSTLGLVSGVAGMMLYALNLILATRLKFLENHFGGLNRMFIAHHITGGIALILLCFHPMLLAARLINPVTTKTIRYAAEFLWIQPISFSMPFTNYMAINFGIIAFLGLVVLLIITFFIKLPYRVWLFTHKFLGAAFFFAGLHVLFIKGTISNDSFIKTYLLFWAVMGITAAAYKTLGGKILIRRYKYRLKSSKKINKEVVELILEPLNQKIDFQPGQFVFINFISSKVKPINNEAHPFSVSSDNTKNTIRLNVKALGDFTKSLQKLEPGTIAEIEGAYGKFSYRNFDNPNQIWIAGGIGITPFLSMAQGLENENHINVDLYYSVNTESEIIKKDELNKIMKNPKFKFRLIPQIVNSDGLLTADMISKQSKGLKEKEIFICGPPLMMKALRKQFNEKGIPNSNIHTEEFSLT